MLEVQVVAKGRNSGLKITDDDGVTWKTYKTQVAAEAAQTAMQLGTEDAGIITLSAFYDRCMEYHMLPNLTRETVASYRRACTSAISPHLGTTTLAKLDAAVVRSFIDTLHSEGMSYRKIKPVVEVLSAILGIAVAWRYIAVNPVSQIDMLLLGNAPE
jgi:hypothetical protein